MCGISGYISTTNGPYSKDIIEKLLTDIEPRGHDATGLAYLEGTQFKVAKAPVVARAFLKDLQYLESEEKIVNSRIVLLHTRAASHGSPKLADNNHPIWNDKGIMTHNGVVATPQRMTAAKGQTDTEQMMLHIQKVGFKGINDLRGWLAITYFDFQSQKLFLYHKDAPMYILKTPDTLVWSSLRSSLETLGLGTVEELPVGRLFSIADHTIDLVDMGTFSPKAYSRIEVTQIQRTAPLTSRDGIGNTNSCAREPSANTGAEAVINRGTHPKGRAYGDRLSYESPSVKIQMLNSRVRDISDTHYKTVREKVYTTFYDYYNMEATKEERIALDALATKICNRNIEEDAYHRRRRYDMERAIGAPSVHSPKFKKVKKNQLRSNNSEVTTIRSSDEDWKQVLASFKDEARRDTPPHGLPPIEMTDRAREVERRAREDWERCN